MMKRLMVLLAMLALLAVLFTGCGGDGSETTPADAGKTDKNGAVEEPDAGGRTFTLAELAEFDGKDGRPAYVAAGGVVYDVSGSAQWPEGDHSPCNLDAAAGKDLSGILEQAPANMRTLVEAMPVVGTLSQ